MKCYTTFVISDRYRLEQEAHELMVITKKSNKRFTTHIYNQLVVMEMERNIYED